MPYTDGYGRPVAGAFVSYNYWGRGNGFANSLKVDVGVFSPYNVPLWPSYATSHFGWGN